MVRVLSQIGPVTLHRPKVHRAVAVAGEVHATAPQHRPFAGTRVVRGQRGRFFVARGETPQLLRGTALVAFGVATLERQACKPQGAVLVEGPVGRLRQRHARFGEATLLQRFDSHELPVGQIGKRRCRVKQLPGGSPGGGGGIAAAKSPALGKPAAQRHRVQVPRALVAGQEGQLPAVRRDRGQALRRGMRGQALGHTAACRDLPQVTLGDEHQGLPVERRLAVVTLGAFGDDPRRTAEQTPHDKTENRSTHGVVPYPRTAT